MATGFGPSALVTPANAVTIARILATPFIFAAVMAGAPSWWTLAFWIVVAASDGLDGWLARRQGSTRSGAFLDPLSDKVLVLAAMAALVARSLFWWLPVALIALREVVVSVWRSQAGRRGVSVPARQWAKAKTIVQEVAVGFALLPLTGAVNVSRVVLWAAVVLTLVTGLDYFRSPSAT